MNVLRIDDPDWWKGKRSHGNGRWKKASLGVFLLTTTNANVPVNRVYSMNIFFCYVVTDGVSKVSDWAGEANIGKQSTVESMSRVRRVSEVSGASEQMNDSTCWKRAVVTSRNSPCDRPKNSESIRKLTLRRFYWLKLDGDPMMGNDLEVKEPRNQLENHMRSRFQTVVMMMMRQRS